MHARMQLQGSSYCKEKVSLRQAPGGQSRFSNQYFLRAFLSSELLLRIKEYTMWTTKRTLSGYLLPLHNFHIWELFLYEFSTISNRRVQKSDRIHSDRLGPPVRVGSTRIHSDRQSGSDQLGSTWTNSDRIKKLKKIKLDSDQLGSLKKKNNSDYKRKIKSVGIT